MNNQLKNINRGLSEEWGGQHHHTQTHPHERSENEPMGYALYPEHKQNLPATQVCFYNDCYTALRKVANKLERR